MVKTIALPRKERDSHQQRRKASIFGPALRPRDLSWSYRALYFPVRAADLRRSRWWVHLVTLKSSGIGAKRRESVRQQPGTCQPAVTRADCTAARLERIRGRRVFSERADRSHGSSPFMGAICGALRCAGVPLVGSEAAAFFTCLRVSLCCSANGALGGDTIFAIGSGFVLASSL